jgi:hypothetical protein
MKGMSIWSLAPQSESAHGEANERCQQMINYKDTADNHHPRDRADSAKLTKPDPHALTNRMSLFKWVDHTVILLTIFFGPECPLIQEGFKPLAGLLQDPKYFHNYTPVNGLGPAYHLGHHLQLQILSGGPPPGPSMLLQVRPQAGDPHGPSGIQWNLLEGGPPGKCQKPNDRTTV